MTTSTPTSTTGTKTKRPPLVGELLIIGALLFVYDHIKRIAHRRPSAAEYNGRELLRIERAVWLDVERGLNNALSAHHALSLAASYSYEILWWSTALIVLVVAYWKAPDRYRLLRNVLVTINIVALVVFFMWPVMPPRLIPGAGFVDSVADAGFGAKHVGRLPADQYAAMPSLHVAWAIYTAWAVHVIARRRVVRWIAVLLPVLTVVDVMATGNHYFLDCVAGAAVTAVAVALMTRVETWSGRRSPHAPDDARQLQHDAPGRLEATRADSSSSPDAPQLSDLLSDPPPAGSDSTASMSSSAAGD